MATYFVEDETQDRALGPATCFDAMQPYGAIWHVVVTPMPGSPGAPSDVFRLLPPGFDVDGDGVIGWFDFSRLRRGFTPESFAWFRSVFQMRVCEGGEVLPTCG